MLISSTIIDLILDAFDQNLVNLSECARRDKFLSLSMDEDESILRIAHEVLADELGCPPNRDTINAYMVYFRGTGSDGKYFYLHECVDQDVVRSKFATLLDYSDYCRESFNEAIKDMPPMCNEHKQGVLCIYGRDARVVDGSEFYYVDLQSLASYIVHFVDDHIEDYLLTLLPESFDVLGDVPPPAKYRKMMEFCFHYLKDLENKLGKSLNDEEIETFIDYEYYLGSEESVAKNSIVVVVRNEATAKKIRLNAFMDDVKKLQCESSKNVKEIIDSEIAKLKVAISFEEEKWETEAQ